MRTVPPLLVRFVVLEQLEAILMQVAEAGGATDRLEEGRAEAEEDEAGDAIEAVLAALNERSDGLQRGLGTGSTGSRQAQGQVEGAQRRYPSSRCRLY